MRALVRTSRVGLAVGALLVLAVTPVPPAHGETACTTTTTSYITDPEELRNYEVLGVEESWQLATGRGVSVAVVDSGVAAGNEHLASAVVPGRSFVGGSELQDAQGHGTVVAGIVAARRVDPSVLVGVAPEATILPVRVFGELSDGGSSLIVADGIRWAAEQGVGVINVSLSTGPSDPNLAALQSAVEFAVSRDVVVVASAGNRPENTPLTQVQYPAGFDGVIGVAAADASGDVDDWSVHGPHVDVSAPGVNVLTSFYDKGDCLIGLDRPYTSYAAAYVSAVAALLRERFPGESAVDITNRILATADRPRAGVRDDRQGWGMVRPVAALQAASASPPGSGDAGGGTRPDGEPPRIESVGPAPDPMAATRTRLLWWAMGASGVVAVAAVARPIFIQLGSMTQHRGAVRPTGEGTSRARADPVRRGARRQSRRGGRFRRGSRARSGRRGASGSGPAKR